MSSVQFNLTNDSGSCIAYLQISDSIEPNNSNIYRTVNSSDLTFTQTGPLNRTSFEIVNSHLNITNNSTNTEINIQYTFTYNNFSTVKLGNIPLGKIFIYKYFKSLITFVKLIC